MSRSFLMPELEGRSSRTPAEVTGSRARLSGGKSMPKTTYVKGNRRDIRPESRVRRGFPGDMGRSAEGGNPWYLCDSLDDTLFSLVQSWVRRLWFCRGTPYSALLWLG